MVLTWCCTLRAQQIELPNLPGPYLEETAPFFNVAARKSQEHKGTVFVSRKQGIGVFSVFHQNYIHANYLIGNDTVKKQAVGLRLINDQAGRYIGMNRVALLYSYAIILSGGHQLHLGAAPTLISYKKQAQNFGGTAFVGNLDLGLWYASGHVVLGLSLNQLVRNTLTLIEEQNVINSQYSF